MFEEYGKQFAINPRDGYNPQWAADRLTLLDIAIANEGGLSELVDETSGAFPEVRLIGSRPIRGTKFKQLVRVELPVTGFRDANEGANRTKGRRENREFGCHIFNPRWEADKITADGAEDGAEAIIAEEAATHVESAFQTLGQQFYYGTIHDAKGFPGLQAIYDNVNMLHPVGGSDADKSSVWLVRLEMNRVQFLVGNGGDFAPSPVRIGDAFDDNNKAFTAYIQEMEAHIGLKVSDLRAVGRISGLTTQNGKTLDDDIIAAAANLFPVGRGPTHLFMNKRSREQLRQSRVTSLLTRPPIPTESHGIEIVTTDAINNAETS